VPVYVYLYNAVSSCIIFVGAVTMFSPVSHSWLSHFCRSATFISRNWSGHTWFSVIWTHLNQKACIPLTFSSSVDRTRGELPRAADNLIIITGIRTPLPQRFPSCTAYLKSMNIFIKISFTTSVSNILTIAMFISLKVFFIKDDRGFPSYTIPI